MIFQSIELLDDFWQQTTAFSTHTRTHSQGPASLSGRFGGTWADSYIHGADAEWRQND